MHKILLYYKYVLITDPKAFRDEHFALCEKLGLTGRVIVSKEGINGTVEGLAENIRAYVAHMKVDPRFSDVDFKESDGTGNAFPRLTVKVRSEIVTLGTGEANDPNFKRGTHISPDELQKWYDEGKDFVIVDMRNDYESNVGRFEDSICMPVQNFREITDEITKKGMLAEYKDKTVISVCTGGVRCEKASAFLIENGFKDVYQLEGGIARYLEKHPGKKFKGSLYVFDGRVIVNYDSPEEHTVVGKCLCCGEPSERCVNCNNLDCHGHFICCEECSKDGVFCSEKCRQSPNILRRGH